MKTFPSKEIRCSFMYLCMHYTKTCTYIYLQTTHITKVNRSTKLVKNNCGCYRILNRFYSFTFKLVSIFKTGVPQVPYCQFFYLLISSYYFVLLSSCRLWLYPTKVERSLLLLSNESHRLSRPTIFTYLENFIFFYSFRSMFPGQSDPTPSYSSPYFYFWIPGDPVPVRKPYWPRYPLYLDFSGLLPVTPDTVSEFWNKVSVTSTISTNGKTVYKTTEIPSH